MLLSLFTYKILVLFSIFSGILYIFSSFSSHARGWSLSGKGVQNRTLGVSTNHIRHGMRQH